MGLIVVLIGMSCASYSDVTRMVRVDADQGNYAAAIGVLNGLLGVDAESEIPAPLGDDGSLTLLERGTLLQAQEHFGLSARDLETADRELEVLDITSDTAGEIGRYVYSDSATVYRPIPVEKLALNAFNMSNYLAQGDLSGAAVEARRFTLAQRFLRDEGADDARLVFGSYLSGFVFEHLGEYDRAMRYYEESLEGGSLQSLRAPVARLASRTRYRGAALRRLIGDVSTSGDPQAKGRSAEILTLVAFGRVPYRVPRRVEVGAAAGLAGAYITGDPSILQYSVLKVVSYPELVPSGTPDRKVLVRVDEREVPTDRLSDLASQVRREYEVLKPKILGAAISRLIARAAIAEGSRVAGEQKSDLAGTLAALFTEGALLTLDRPDTRSWTMLPAWVVAARTPVVPGRHRVELELVGAPGQVRQVDVDVPESGFAAVVWTSPR
ncbi:hypothetical protein MK489_08540 [Myxococcota bacterium]|nr:hypothetical protein [Myxococcota bacterium]